MTTKELLDWVTNPNETPNDRQVRIAQWFEDETGIPHSINIDRDVRSQAEVDAFLEIWNNWRLTKATDVRVEIQRLIDFELKSK
jgi:ribosome-associated toxin RatA of RatAB toxin-antitoxin module